LEDKQKEHDKNEEGETEKQINKEETEHCSSYLEGLVS
jgi:hypothetical protein